MRVVVLEYKESTERLAQSIAELAEFVIVVRLEKDLPGVWSEYGEKRETVRIGYLENSPHAFFHALSPPENSETCFSRALSRIVFGRKMSHVVIREKAFIHPLMHALHGHDVLCWYGKSPLLPDELHRAESDERLTEQALLHKLEEASAHNG